MKCPACHKRLSLKALSQPGKLRTCNHCRTLLEITPYVPGIILSILAVSLMCGLTGYLTGNMLLIPLVVVAAYPVVIFWGYRFRTAAKGPSSGR